MDEVKEEEIVKDEAEERKGGEGGSQTSGGAKQEFFSSSESQSMTRAFPGRFMPLLSHGDVRVFGGHFLAS